MSWGFSGRCRRRRSPLRRRFVSRKPREFKRSYQPVGPARQKSFRIDFAMADPLPTFASAGFLATSANLRGSVHVGFGALACAQPAAGTAFRCRSSASNSPLLLHRSRLRDSKLTLLAGRRASCLHESKQAAGEQDDWFAFPGDASRPARDGVVSKLRTR